MRLWNFLRILFGVVFVVAAAARPAWADDAGAPPEDAGPADEADAGAPAAPPAAPSAAPAPVEAPDNGPTLAPTEAEKARDQPIAKVTLAGNRRVTSEDISGYLQNMRPGKPFTPEGL